MQILIDHQYRPLIPLPHFREQWSLPNDFQVAYFEPKDWTGLGSMEGAGRELAVVRQRVVQMVPVAIRPADLITVVEDLSAHFEGELRAVNAQVGLREPEIEFAVAGFQDLLQAAAYRLIQLVYTRPQAPAELLEQFDYTGLYQTWLAGSVRISAKTHLYRQEEREFRVRVLYNIYGRVGLEVELEEARYYVEDMSLACPAASYMRHLCGEVAEKLARNLIL